MVIPDEVKQQLLYHYPNAKFKVKHGAFYTAELQELGPNKFYYGSFGASNNLKPIILHCDGQFRTSKSKNMNFDTHLLIKSIQHDPDNDLDITKLNYGYLIEII